MWKSAHTIRRFGARLKFFRTATAFLSKCALAEGGYLNERRSENLSSPQGRAAPAGLSRSARGGGEAAVKNMRNEEHKRYDRMVRALTPNSNYIQGYLRAFWVGGVICMLGQLISLWGEKKLGLPENSASMLTSVILIFMGTTLTGIGVYDDIGHYAGAGSIVPITGFANSIAAPAMEFRREGLILGVGAKLFAIAGPVLVYGVASSIIVGAIYWLIGRLAR